MSLPSLSARIQILDLGRKSGLHPPDFPVPPVSLGGGRNLFHVSIQEAKIDTEMQASILFPYQYHGITPGTLARSNGTRFQHFLQVIPNLLNHWWWDSSKPFFKRGIISHFYYMLYGMGTT